jgi:hypothetical protein
LAKKKKKKKTDGGTVYKWILIDAKLKTEKRGQKTAGWEHSIKEAKVHIRMKCHLRRRKWQYH